jgi:HNH endonuclease
VELPAPDSPELHGLISNSVTREIYRVLYEHHGTPIGIHQIRELIGSGVGVQQHLDRRLRDLDPYFLISRGRAGRETTYVLVERLDVIRGAQGSISKTLRAWVLRDQRCAQCGRTPTVDGLRLHVDHKIPQRWGGTNDPENLQALCSECNEGKSDYYATFDDEAPAVLRAFTYDEAHVRIGEALKAAYPKRLRGDFLERVASAKQYQEDWQKRLRELRLLGWKIEASRQNEQGRAVAYYQLLDPAPPWPEGNVRSAIRAVEKERGY